MSDPVSLWAAQQQLHIMRNLIASGLLDIETMKKNLESSKTDLSNTYPQHTSTFHDLYSTYISAIDGLSQE